MRMTSGGHEGPFAGAENVLKPNCADGCTALLIYKKSLNRIL